MKKEGFAYDNMGEIGSFLNRQTNVTLTKFPSITYLMCNKVKLMILNIKLLFRQSDALIFIKVSYLFSLPLETLHEYLTIVGNELTGELAHNGTSLYLIGPESFHFRSSG